MDTHCSRGLIRLFGCLGAMLAAAASADSPTRQALDAFSFAAIPATRPAAPGAVETPEVAPSFLALRPDDGTAAALNAALAAEQEKSPALIVWNLKWNTQLTVLGRPTVHKMLIPWSPMTTNSDLTFSPSSLGGSTSKLQARLPLVSMTW